MLLRTLTVALFALVASVTGALAHAGLISAEPADGAVVGDAPAAMVLIFTEPVSPIAFSVVGLDGAPTLLTADRQDGPIVHVPLPSLGKGSYLFSWRVTSEDGHPVNGTVSFAVGAPSGTIAGAASDTMLVASIWFVRTLQYVALFLGVGSTAFGALTVLPTGVRRVSCGLSLGGLLFVVPAMGLQGIDLLGLPFSALFSVAPWSEALASPYAQTQALLALAFGLALIPGRVPAIAAGIIGALAPMLSGHASMAEPQLLMRGAVFVHMASLMFWLGALIPLIATLRGGDGAALRRFSRIIPWVIGALLASGLALALVQLGPPRDDWLSPYGVLLGAKLSLVAILLLLGLWNRAHLTSRAHGGDTRPLRRSIVAELVLVALILAVVAGWRFTPPPRVLAVIEAASAPIPVTLTASNAAHADMVVTPGRPGPVTLDIALPVTAESVTVLLENTGQDIATIRRPATHGIDQHWGVGLLLPAAGDWSIVVQARTGKFDVITFTGTLSFVGKDTAMHPTKTAALVASSILLAAPVSAAGLLPSCATGQSFTQGAITVSGAFSRATPPNAQSAGGYLTIHNTGSAVDTLTGVTSEAAKDVSIHQMKMNGNVMEMSAVENGLPVPAGGTVSLDPMGYHLMLTGMAAPLVQGQCLDMVLHFAKAGDVTVQFNIGGYAQKVPPTDGAPASSMEMSSMDMSGMSSMSSMQGM